MDIKIPRFSRNNNIKIMLGIPASAAAADGYVDASGMVEFIKNVTSYPQFASIMM
jgi:hypothetical protein